jgi:hypothetical protein
MFIGHIAVGLAAKQVAPRTSLGTLLAAATGLDLLWPVLLLLGVEKVRIVPGITAVTPLDFVDYPWSHSLLLACAWGALFGGVYLVARRERTAAAVLAAAVVSHWVLDLVSHRPDLPLVPGGSRYGLGLWDSPIATVLVETALFAVGVTLYARATRARDRVGAVALWSLVVFLLVVYAANLTGPPPPSERAIGWLALSAWIFVPWGAWIDRHRAAVV